MKSSLLPIIFFFTFFHSMTNAQEFKLGKVSIAELEEKQHPKDPSAVAAILFKKGEVIFEYSDNKGFEVVTTVKTRIKIYKKEGYSWANQEVQYDLNNSLNEKVIFSEASTYNLVNGKIEKTKLKSDGEFTEKINKYWGQKKITMPNVKEGSVLEFEYSLRTGYIGALRDWYFQYSIPVNFSEYTTYIPEYFDYRKNQKGFTLIQTGTEKLSKRINYVSTINNGDGNKPIRSNEELNFIETKTTHTVKDVPAMLDEAFVNNIDNYTSSISQELAMTKYPNSALKTYSTDWESVVKTIYNYDDFGPELNKTGYFEDDINKLITGIDIPNERIIAIFNFVKTNIKWNNYTGYSCIEGVKTAYKNKTGNSAEINLMLTAMLRFAGLNVTPVLLSTRDHGISFFPNRTAFNYVISAVETPEGLILLDATEKYSVPNTLPLRDLNWYGRLIRKDGTSTEVDLMSKILSKQVTNMNIIVKSDGSSEGKVRNQFTDYEALAFRKENLAKSKESYLEALETENNNIEVNDYVRENDLNLSQPIVEGYSFVDRKDAEVINGKIYFSPLLFFAIKENPFKQEVREYPIDFSYPTLRKYNINIEIPEGYVVESMPTSVNVTTGSDIGSFKYMISNTENKIQVAFTSTINTSIVSSDFYPIIKGFFQQMVDKENEKIVLKKI